MILLWVPDSMVLNVEELLGLQKNISIRLCNKYLGRDKLNL